MSGQISTKAVKEAAASLEAAYTALAKARNDYALVKAHNGQVGYSISVNGVRVDVSVMDSRTYMPALIRGREMIHLGALKALQAVIAYWEYRVVECEAQLVAATGKGGAE